MAEALGDEQLRAIYAWIDSVPLSRPKKNIARDFADGVMLAEVIAAYFPHLVELHNYPAASSVKQKVYNFETLNRKVLKKMGYTIPRSTIDDMVSCKPGVVEVVLNQVQLKMAKLRGRRAEESPKSQSISYDERDTVGGAPSAQRLQVDPKENIQQFQQQNRFPQPAALASVDKEILAEKERQIRELHETVEILELKIAKLEQLVRLKDNKIQKLLSSKGNV